MAERDTILVVDDSPESLGFLTDALGQGGESDRSAREPPAKHIEDGPVGLRDPFVEPRELPIQGPTFSLRCLRRVDLRLAEVLDVGPALLRFRPGAALPKRLAGPVCFRTGLQNAVEVRVPTAKLLQGRLSRVGVPERDFLERDTVGRRARLGLFLAPQRLPIGSCLLAGKLSLNLADTDNLGRRNGLALQAPGLALPA